MKALDFCNRFNALSLDNKQKTINNLTAGLERGEFKGQEAEIKGVIGWARVNMVCAELTPPSAEQKVKTEKTADLINIHNFLTSIVSGPENLSVFELWSKLEWELRDRPDAQKYLDAMDKLLGTDKYKFKK